MYRYFFLFLFLSVSTILSSQPTTTCTIDVMTYAKEQDIAKLLAVLQQIESCPDALEEKGQLSKFIGTQYFEQKQYKKAIRYYRQSIQHWKSVSEVHEGIGKNFFNIGLSFGKLGVADSTIFYNNKTIAYFEQQGNYEDLEYVLNHSIRYYYEEGNFHAVISTIEQIQTEGQQLLGIDQLWYWGESYSETGAFQKAERIFKKILDLDNDAYTLLSLANLYNKSNALDKATRYYEKTLNIAENTQDDYLKVSVLNNYVSVYRKKENYPLALQYINESIALQQQDDADPSDLAHAYDNKGAILKSMERWSEARTEFARAVHTAKPDTRLNQNVYVKDYFTYLSDLADIFLVEYEHTHQAELLDSAILYFKIGDLFLSKQRSRYLQQASKLYWSAASKSFYEKAIHACYYKQNIDLALQFFEQSKALLLAEQLALHKGSSILPKEVGELLATYTQQISEGELVEGSPLSVEYETLKKNIQINYPNLYNSIFNLEQIDLSFARHVLKASNKDAAIQYFYGSSKVYAIVLTTEKAALVQLDVAPNLLYSFLEYMKTPTDFIHQKESFSNIAAQLYTTLIPENAAVERLLIIPDGHLNLIPFDALLYKPLTTIEADIAEWPWLLKRSEVSYAYSFQSLQQQQSQEIAQEGTTIFAPFTNQGIRGMRPLPHLDTETAHLANQASIFEDEAATSKAFLTQTQPARIYHLSTHAWTGDSTAIAFFDTNVDLDAIYPLNFKGSFITLSACQTNVGKLAKGEGVLSLSRAFSYCGAKNVMASLWSINEMTTAELFKDFYAFSQDNTIQAALRKAKLARLTADLPMQARSPHHWAGMMATGADYAMVETTFPTYLWWIILAVMGIGIYFFKKNQKK